jgi:hypothetical protein
MPGDVRRHHPKLYADAREVAEGQHVLLTRHGLKLLV